MERSHPPQEYLEKPNPVLTGAQKFEKILGLFGTETAKENFFELCKEYYEIRIRDDAHAHGENYRTSQAQYSPAKRSNLHNNIMSTLKRLSLGKMDTETRAALNEMADREVTAGFIKDFMRTYRPSHDDDDDDSDAYGNPKRSGGQSSVAYFRSLGKGE